MVARAVRGKLSSPGRTMKNDSTMDGTIKKRKTVTSINGTVFPAPSGESQALPVLSREFFMARGIPQDRETGIFSLGHKNNLGGSNEKIIANILTIKIKL